MHRIKKKIDNLKISNKELKIIDKYIGLVHHILRKLMKRQKNYILLEEEDLFQYGMLALLRAIKTYNKKKGKFSSYCYSVIRNELINKILENRSIIRIPPWINSKNFHKIKDYNNIKNFISLNKVIDNSDGTIEYIDTIVDKSTIDIDKKIYVDEILASLNKRKRYILIQKLFYSKTFIEIGKELGISKQRAQQIYKEAILELRLKLT